MSVTVLVSQSSREWARHLDDTSERWILRHELDVDFKPLENAFDVNEIRKMPFDQFKVFIEDMERNVLLDLKQELDNIIAEIRIQRKESWAYHTKSRGWLYSVKKVRKICGRYSQAIQNELSNKKNFKYDINYTLPKLFMNIAEDELDTNDFEFIKEKALEELRRAERK